MAGQVVIREQPVPQAVQEPLREWLARMQSGAMTALRALASMPIVQGAHVRDVTIASGANQIAHQLGRMPRGWIVTRQSASLTLYESATQLTQRDGTFLYLTAGAAGTVDLWVF